MSKSIEQIYKCNMIYIQYYIEKIQIEIQYAQTQNARKNQLKMS